MSDVVARQDRLLAIRDSSVDSLDPRGLLGPTHTPFDAAASHSRVALVSHLFAWTATHSI